MPYYPTVVNRLLVSVINLSEILQPESVHLLLVDITAYAFALLFKITGAPGQLAVILEK